MLGGLTYSGLKYKHWLIEENLDIRPDHRVTEIGIGTGYSCFKLAKRASQVLGVDIAEELLQMLKGRSAPFTNLSFLKANVSSDEPPEELRSIMNEVISIDTLNYISRPENFFAYVSQLLKPGGKALICFPNEPDKSMEGVTNFKDDKSILTLIEKSGLVCLSLRAAEHTKWFHFINDNLWYRIKRIFYRSHYDGKTNPQVFTDTVAFKMLKEKKRGNVFIGAYSAFIMALLRLGGVYRYVDTKDIYGKYVVMTLSKPRK